MKSVPFRWSYLAGACGLAVVGYGSGQFLGQARPGGPAAGVAALTPVSAAPLAGANVDGGSSSVVLAQRKRIMGRLRSLEMVRRTATRVRPLVDAAIEQPGLQADLRALAASAGMDLAEYKEYFKGKQEADLLLESGGDPNARSVADAIGVAQFMVATGQRCGLKVDIRNSNALSRKIAGVEKQLAALEAQPANWTKAVPVELRGAAPRLASASLPPGLLAGAVPDSVWTRDQWISYRKSQRDGLVAKRRNVDHRFDPGRSITAQTRYLVKLTRRYGGVDWALQAYHGGEAGASRTVRLFDGGTTSGSRMPYSELYRRVSPVATPAAFSYLFGRSDDHRYYWWKVLMAERALNLYRQDPAEFERQWQELRPGYSADVAYYQDPAPLQFADNNALRDGFHTGTLVSLPANAGAYGVRTMNLAALEPASAGLHKGLRPEAMGALLQLGQVYRSNGGRAPLDVVAMVQSAAYRQLWDARYPDPPLKGNTPKDPEYHTTGLVFDLKQPANAWDRKVLEFALGRLYDNLRISWRKENEGGSLRYHVVANPEFKDELAEYSRRASR